MIQNQLIDKNAVKTAIVLGVVSLLAVSLVAQDSVPLVIPAPLGIPAPAAVTDQPYAPQPILPGGIVVPLYPSDSAFLNQERIKEAEKYNMSGSVPGRISSIVNIHNPSIEVHLVERGPTARRVA